MARGGFRPGSGRKKKLKTKGKAKKPNYDVKTSGSKEKAEPADLTPLEYMLQVMNDPNEDFERRDYMAISAAPYCHARGGEKGKKEKQGERAKNAGAGKFSSGKPPLKLVPRVKGFDNE